MKKILVCLLVLSVMSSLASCAKEKKNTETETAPATAETKGEEPVTAEPTTEEAVTAKEETKENAPAEKPYEKAYADLVSDYKKLIEFRFSDAFGDTWYDNLSGVGFSTTFRGIIDAFATEDHSDSVSNMMVELPDSFSQEGAGDFGYILHDLNKDQTPELFWVRKDHSIVAVFTYKDGSALFVDSFWSRYRGYVSDKGALYGWGSSGVSDNRCSVQELTADGVLEVKYGFSGQTDWLGDPAKINYFEYNGSVQTPITQARFEELSHQYPQKPSNFWLSLSIQELSV